MAMWRSKLGNQYPKAEIDKLDKNHHATLKELRKLPENSTCAECGSSDTSWASVNLGVFVCMQCADVHRHLGTHISKMKGCSGTYLWGPDEIEQMQVVGNQRALGAFCACNTTRIPKMSPKSSKEELVDFCRKKYSDLLWASDEMKSAIGNGDGVRAGLVGGSQNFQKAQHVGVPSDPVLTPNPVGSMKLSSTRQEVLEELPALLVAQKKALSSTNVTVPLKDKPKMPSNLIDFDDAFFDELEMACSETARRVDTAVVQTTKDNDVCPESCLRFSVGDVLKESQLANVDRLSLSCSNGEGGASEKTNSTTTHMSLNSSKAPTWASHRSAKVPGQIAAKPLPAEGLNTLDGDAFFSQFGL